MRVKTCRGRMGRMLTYRRITRAHMRAAIRPIGGDPPHPPHESLTESCTRVHRPSVSPERGAGKPAEGHRQSARPRGIAGPPRGGHARIIRASSSRCSALLHRA